MNRMEERRNEQEMQDEQETMIETKDFVEPERLYAQLLASMKRYHPSTDLTLIEKAYQAAAEAHKEQKRKSGEPYIIHPLSVAIILAELELDKETIAAGLLHDIVEDTAWTAEEVTKVFGADVELLVDGVTKLDKLSYSKDKLEMQADNLRKMFLAMAKDIRVILIKLADRLHNMRTLKYMRPEKQVEIAQETLDIYAPIAERLGIMKIKIELDDLALKYVQPDVYYDLVEKINLKKSERESYIKGLVKDIKRHLDDSNIPCEITGRFKHFFSIYKKMKNQDKTLDQIYDLFAVRIIVDQIQDCYAVLGIIHEMYKPIPGRFKDYIAMPKPNMYQSLHTTLIGSLGQLFEVQIRTWEMHKTAEFGIAAHWKYKENADGKKVDGQEEAKMSWLREVLEWQKDMSDSREFMNSVKNDLDVFSESVYCFTPEGDVKNLPNGSTTIDFAYSIHSAVGNRMIGARVNGKLVPIDYVVQNGDRIEILTSQNSNGPSRDWLSIVKSSQAKSKISQWFKQQLKEENVIKGKELVAQYCKMKCIPLSDIMKPEYQDCVMRRYGFKDWESVLAAVGHGGLKEGQIVNRLREEYIKEHKKAITDKAVLESIANKERVQIAKSKNGIVVKGIDDVTVRFSRCCNPIPGDEIVGYVTRGRGVSIHRTDCVNVINLPENERMRLIEAEWQSPEIAVKGTYGAEIQIFANNRVGLIVDVSKVFSERNIDISGVKTQTGKNGIVTMAISFGISSKSALNEVIEKLRQVESVIDIQRTSG